MYFGDRIAVLTNTDSYMLHIFNFLKFTPGLLIGFLVLFCVSCKQDSSSHSEEESAYLADYESPSDHWGFINTEGNLVIKAEYDDAGPFSEGLAAVNKNGKWGFIDKEGKTVIEPVYKSAWAFHEGFARVLPFDGPDRFINKEGETTPADNWAAADDFAEGRARVKVGNLFGYIDASGQLIIQPIYTRGWNFGNGITVIEYQEKLGVIDQQGKYILQPEYDQIKKSAHDKILLCRKGDDAIAYNSRGKKLLEIKKAKMIDSNESIVSVREGNNMYLMGIADPAKKSSSFSNIIYLEQDLWAAKTDSGYVLVNHEGNRVNTNYYTQINKFSEDYAAYSKDDYWGYLDVNGKELTGEVFGLAWDYRGGFARAAFKEGIAFIDRNQKLAFYPPNGSLDMRDFSENLAAVLLD
jgi:hypothetical protein